MADQISPAEQRVRAGMQNIWQQSLPLLRGHLQDIERCRQQLQDWGHTSGEERDSAASAAHKLAGVMGMFGHPEGTAAARSIEQLLAQKDLAAPALLAAIDSPVASLRAALHPPGTA